MTLIRTTIAALAAVGLAFGSVGSALAGPVTQAITGDFNGDDITDILLTKSGSTDSNGMAFWFMDSSAQIAAGSGTMPQINTHTVAGTGDFGDCTGTADAITDLVLLANDGLSYVIWCLSGDLSAMVPNHISIPLGSALSIVGVGDFDGDGFAREVLVRDGSDNAAIMVHDSSGALTGSVGVGVISGTAIIGDFDGVFGDDVLAVDGSNNVNVFLISDSLVVSGFPGIGSLDPAITPVAARDMNGDGMSDIILQHTNGEIYGWLMNGILVNSALSIGNPLFEPGTVMQDLVAGAMGDFNGPTGADIVLQQTGVGVATVAVWRLNSGGTFNSEVVVAASGDTPGSDYETAGPYFLRSYQTGEN